MRAPSSLRDNLRSLVQEGTLYKQTDDGRVQCYACGHRCIIGEGRDGICKVRFNRNNKLWVPHGYTAGIQLDPVEKKPFFHVFPGSTAMSFGMLGCDLHCAYCQNWITSQALQDPYAGLPPRLITAAELAQHASDHGARLLTSTYNEPLITAEWAVRVFEEGQRLGLYGAFVSNGNATPEVLTFLRPYVSMYKVDLKSFNDKNYRKLGTTLKNVTDSIEKIHAMGFWLEIVTLIVPGFNDSDAELQGMASFIKKISSDIPWHVTAFHPDYKMTDPDETDADTLARAAHIGKNEGLHFVYTGNRPGELRDMENTYCPGCKALLVKRHGYRIQQNRIIHGKCPNCDRKIPGYWS